MRLFSATAGDGRAVHSRPVADPSPAHRPRRGLLRRLYDWTMSWSRSRHALAALFLIAFAESSFFPIPPDVLLIAMSFADPRKAFLYAAVAGSGSVLGGVAGHVVGRLFWDALGPFFFDYVPGFTPAHFEAVRAAYRENAFWAIFSAAFTPIPYKVFTIAAGVFHIPLPVLVLASVAGRFGRFFLVGGVIFFTGDRLRLFIERYFEWVTIAFAALLIGGFVAVKYVL